MLPSEASSRKLILEAPEGMKYRGPTKLVYIYIESCRICIKKIRTE
jgi:hypothetical protein